MTALSDLVSSLRDLVERERERFGVPGCAVAVLHEGEVLLAEGFGLRDVAAGLPVTVDTLFAIGSSTKTFTAAVVASLVQEGVVDLDAPLRTYLPGFTMLDPVAAQQLTLRDCLAHRSGLPRHDTIWYAGEGVRTREDVLAGLPHLPSNLPFRQAWQYNNLLYLLAGHLAGELTGTSYEGAVQKRLLDPLGMVRTNADVAASQADPDHARPYVSGLGPDGAPGEVPFASLHLAGPAGCLNSSAAELVPWLRTLLGEGVDGAEPLLSAAVLDQMRAPAVPMPVDPAATATAVGYGLGFMVGDYQGHRVVHHGGNIDGFSSMVLTVPALRLGVAVLTNLHVTALREVVPYAVVDAVLGRPDAGHGERGLERQTVMLAAMKASAQGAAARSTGAPTVRPLGDYVGRYAHPGYGSLEVAGDDDGLALTYGRCAGSRLVPRHLEVFTVELQLAGEVTPVAAQFHHDLEGAVSALSVRFEATVEPIRFTRVVDDSHLTDALLDGLTGTYVLGPMRLGVARRGDRGLTASFNGGAPVLLRLVSGTTFAMDDAVLGFDGAGTIDTPYGAFVRSG